MKDRIRAAVFTNPDRDPDYSYTKKVIRTLLACDADVLTDMRFRGCVGESREDVKFYTYTEEMLKNSDVVVILGGDGSILDICDRAAAHDLPIFGINLGHLGYLTAIEKDEIRRLADLADGNYTIDERMMLDVKITDSGISHELHALNEVAITSGIRAKIADFSVKCDGNKAIPIRADGIIVATPTGSTAYSLSAGGPVIDTRTELFCITPVSPHSLSSRPMVVSADSVITISGKTLAAQTDIYIAADGRKGLSVSERSSIEIRRSPMKTRLIRIGEEGFFDILTKKMYGV